MFKFLLQQNHHYLKARVFIKGKVPGYPQKFVYLPECPWKFQIYQNTLMSKKIHFIKELYAQIYKPYLPEYPQTQIEGLIINIISLPLPSSSSLFHHHDPSSPSCLFHHHHIIIISLPYCHKVSLSRRATHSIDSLRKMGVVS